MDTGARGLVEGGGVADEAQREALYQQLVAQQYERGSAINMATTSRYRITGTWENPVSTLVSREGARSQAWIDRQMGKITESLKAMSQGLGDKGDAVVALCGQRVEFGTGDHGGGPPSPRARRGPVGPVPR